MRSRIHHYIYLLALTGVAVGMSSSNALNSISQAVLAINWLAEGNYLFRLKKFITNKPAMVLCSFYVMHLIGLLYTTNFNYGLEDIDKKLPLFLFPFILSSSVTLSDKEKRIVFLLFMAALTVVSFIGCHLLFTHQLIDIHDIIPSIAPVRFAMMLLLSIFIVSDYVFTNKFSWLSIGLLIWISWFLIFIFIMQSLTAIVMGGVIILILLLVSAIKSIINKKYLYGIGTISLFIIGISASAIYLIHFDHYYFPPLEKIHYSTLDKLSPQGNLYYGDSTDEMQENGHRIYKYICDDELKRVWSRRSKIHYDSNDLKGNQLRYTLFRYLTSLDYRKDSVGLTKLSDKDIKAIELGIPNYQFNSLSSMRYRLYQVFWEIKEYRNSGDINGHSVTMRLEYSSIALHLMKQHPIIGVGTGDVRKAFDNYYVETHSKLSPEWRLRAHDQYLEIAVGFGLIGLFWFLFSIFYPAIKTKKIFTFVFGVFFIMIVLSFLTEDTLETEAGATFYAFFNSFFLFV